MPISVECPACESEFNIPNSFGGKKGKCPECGNVFVAPSADAPKPPPRASVPPPEPKPSANGKTAPVPPPMQLAAQPTDARPAEPPPIADGLPVAAAPPVDDSAFAADRSLQPPRPEKDSRPGESRPRGSKNTPLWIAVGILSAMLVVCVVLLVKNMRLDGKELVTDSDDTPKTNAAKTNQDADDVAEEPAREAVPTKQDLKDVQLKQLSREARPAVFRLVAKRGEKKVPGLAFAIDERGWLATSYQLVRDAEAVEVSAIGDPSTESVAATGIVASNAERNLAIIAIEQKPVATLDLEPSTPKTDEELAVSGSEANELKLVPGVFQRQVSFAEISANSRAIARLLGLDEMNSIWLEHDQQIGSGARGGPLLNLDGKVVGVNTILSPESKVGLALPAAYLKELADSAGDEVVPFAEGADVLASSDSSTTAPENNEARAEPEPPSRAEPGSLESIHALRELHQTCKDIDWQPETPAEYELLQDLAEYVYVAKVNESNESIEKALRVLIASPAQEVLVALSKTPWPEEAGMQKVNMLAAEGLKEESKGVFCYIEIADTTPDPMAVDDVPVILCELIGTGQSILVPVKKSSPKLKRKTRWLLIGKHDPAKSQELRAGDGSEKVASLVQAKHLLGEPKKLPPKAPARRRGRR